MRFVLISILALSFVGCATHKVVGTSLRGEHRVVTVRYTKAMVDSINEGRKQDSIATAKNECGGGKVKLLEESDQSELVGYKHGENYSGGITSRAVNMNYRFLHFECLDKKNAEEVY